MTREHVFVRLDEFDFDDFLQEALPALERRDPFRLLQLLSDKLNRAVRAAVKADHEYPGYSTLLVRSLDQADSIDSSIAHLARAVARTAERAATSRQDAERVFGILAGYDNELFQRLQLRLLAATGQLVAERLNAFLMSSIAVEPPFRAREVAAVLREQFSNASPESQHALVQAIKGGPPSIVGPAADHEVQPDDQALAAWQRRRLKWFRDRIPEALQELARTVGVIANQHSPREEGLAEDGVYIGGGFVGEKSPATLAALTALDAESFVEYVLTWRPDHIDWISPTVVGLDRMLKTYGSENPDEALIRAQLLLSRLQNVNTDAVGHLQALIDGLWTAVQSGRVSNWSATLRLVHDTWLAADSCLAALRSPDHETQRADWQPWQWLCGSIVEFVIVASRADAIPLDQMALTWEVVDSITNSRQTWLAAETAQPASFGEILSAAHNNTAGRATEAVLELACADYRSRLGAAEGEPTAERRAAAVSSVCVRLRPLLELILAQSGIGALAAQAIIGTYIPALHLIDREWVVSSASRLFEGGTREPTVSPAWAAYVTRSSLFDSIFSDFRDWYSRAVADVHTIASNSDTPQPWSITQHLAEHVFGAFLRGLIELDDPLVSILFQSLPAHERAHLSWQVFRGWTDATHAIDGMVVDRLLSFWRWRLEVLGSSPPSVTRDKELSGFGWLICTPHLPERVVLDLGLETLRLSAGDTAARGAIWDRLGTLAVADADVTYLMAECLIDAAIERPNGYIPFERVERVLRFALASGTSETTSAATRLVHKLGQHGHIEFGRLLTSPHSSDEDSSGRR